MSGGLSMGSARALLQVAGLTLATWGCGQTQRDQHAPPVVDTDVDADGGSGGEGPVATADPVWCDAGGKQVSRNAKGQVEPTGVVCTVKVIVDDETSVPCTTKADGTYRCWSDTVAKPLPTDDYQQVQQGPEGLTALTRDGRIVSPRGQPSIIDAPVIELTATNMWGAPGLCYRTDAAGPLWIWTPGASDPDFADSVRVFDGPFLQTLCVYEGLGYGLRPDGSVFDIHSETSVSAGFKQLAASLHLICGVREDGSVACSHGWAPLRGPCRNGYANEYCPEARPKLEAPIFPADQYLQVATSYETVCATTQSRALVCLRGDGELLARPVGRYVAVAAGGAVICAIRVDGSTQCWKREADGLSDVDPSLELAPYSPAPSDGW